MACTASRPHASRMPLHHRQGRQSGFRRAPDIVQQPHPGAVHTALVPVQAPSRAFVQVVVPTMSLAVTRTFLGGSSMAGSLRRRCGAQVIGACGSCYRTGCRYAAASASAQINASRKQRIMLFLLAGMHRTRPDRFGVIACPDRATLCCVATLTHRDVVDAFDSSESNISQKQGNFMLTRPRPHGT